MKKIIPPSKEELEELLFEKLWTKKQIREHYKVSKRLFRRWMIQYDLIGEITMRQKVNKWKKTLSQKPKKFNFKALLKRALKGEKICVPGFNSDFVEEYLNEPYYEHLWTNEIWEDEVEDLKRQEEEANEELAGVEI